MSDATPPGPALGPLTEKGLKKLKNVVQGNGVPVEKIQLIGADETELKIAGELELKPDVMRTQNRYRGAYAGGKKANAVQVRDAQQMQAGIDELKNEVAQSEDWVNDAYQQLKGEPGQGWGLEEADVSLDNMARVFFITETCPTCQGRGNKPCNVCYGSGHVPCQRCQTMGRELCYTCNGTGNYGTPDNQTYCPTCRGATLATCRVCMGNKQVNCNQCSGRGTMACDSCGGEGKATIEETVTPVAKVTFITRDTNELPSGFRRAISRGGMQSLAKGHATITMHPVNKSDETRIVIPYTATLPYAELRVRVNGKAMPMTVLGHKCSVLDVPPFLDALVEDDMAALEVNPSAPGGFEKALKWRLLNDAFTVTQNGEPVRNMRRFYPFGFSPAMLERAYNLMQRMARSHTFMPRLMAGGAGLLALAGVHAGILLSGVRASLGNPSLVLALDMGLAAASGFGTYQLLQFVAKQRMASLVKTPAVGAHKPDMLDMATIGIAGILYFVLMALLGSTPDWFAMIGK